MARGWHKGMVFDVFFAAIIAATFAVANTLPFLTESEMIAVNASVLMRMVPLQRAILLVSAFEPTSTITTLPFSSRCVSPMIFPQSESFDVSGFVGGVISGVLSDELGCS